MTEFNKPTQVRYVTLEDFNKPDDPLAPKTEQQFYDELRNGVIEEVALHFEKLKAFGQDTTSSLAIYIRGMKK
jgi:hypothetical protein